MTEILRLAAFTTDPCGGNPAGVVLDSDGLDEARMQHIAAEVGYSETAFVTDDGRDPRHFQLRFFSPLAEVDFCGHATIATAVAIADRDGAGPLTFATPAGQIEVDTTRTERGLTAALRSVPTRSHPAEAADVTAALQTLGWSAEDLEPQLPPHVSFAGNEHLVLPVRSRRRLAELDYDFEALKALMLDRGWTTLQLFWRQDQTTIHSRNPFPVGGVVEDPATGAAAAALGGYLRICGHIPAPAQIKIVQGEDMGRRSELLISVSPNDPRVTVSGAAVHIPPSGSES
jgi:PhzF family phenazine biosynthesis protein